jgi:HK97 family phage prohead protease
MMFTERRYLPNSQVEARSVGGRAVIAGYAAVFGANSKNLGGFVEVVGRGAFTKTVKEADVRAYVNHDPNLILGRTASGSLKLSLDDNGLHYEIMAGNRSYETDLMESIERGDVNQSSFAFSVVGPEGESWGYNADGFPQRTLNEVRLYDVSPVSNPAYEDTTTGLGERSLHKLAEFRGVDLATLVNVPTDIAVRALLEGSDVVTEIVEASESVEDTNEERDEAELTATKLAIARARLDLLAHS